jgi:hypothetical protein
MNIMRTLARTLVAVGAIASAGCDEWLTVPNPTVIDINALDPVADAPVLAGSAQQNFSVAYGWLIMYSSWFVGESDVAETFPTRNEFGRRDLVEQNGSHNTDVWFPLSQAAASAYLVLNLSDLPDPPKNINLLRGEVFLGYSYVLMAEMFCTGTVLSGPALSPLNMLDSAVAHFTKAIDIGTANGTADAVTLANVSRVGRARAHLQAGRKSQAATDAASVPAGFNFNLNYADDLANRTRLGNRLWQFIADRGSIAVSPIFRVTDPRVPQRVAPSNLLPQDANYTVDRGVPYVIQNKYPTFNAPIRLASKMEADYIAAEAGGDATMLALIQARRAANGQPPYNGGVTGSTLYTEFMWQRGYEFYLEGKRLGDFRRADAAGQGSAVGGMPVPGSTYWKPGFAPVGAQKCWLLPTPEIDNNPNLSPGGN